MNNENGMYAPMTGGKTEAIGELSRVELPLNLLDFLYDIEYHLFMN